MIAHSYACRTMAVIVHREGESVYSDYATTIRITSEGGGEYVEVVQEASLTPSRVAITSEEWPALRDAIEKMLSECQP